MKAAGVRSCLDFTLRVFGCKLVAFGFAEMVKSTISLVKVSLS